MLPASYATLTEGLKQQFMVEHAFDSDTITKGQHKLAYQVLSLTDKPVTSITKIKTSLWMPTMGHGSKPFKTYTTEDKSRFVAADASFFMSGLWEIIIDLEDDKNVDQIRIPVRVK